MGYDCNVSTPWGKADNSTVMCRGVVLYETPSHGGLCCTVAWAKRNLTPHAQYSGMRLYGKLWYEEDCAISIVMYEHPEIARKLSPNYYAGKSDAEISLDHLQTIKVYNQRYLDLAFQQICHDNPIVTDLQRGDEIQIQDGRLFIVLDARDRKRYLVADSTGGGTCVYGLRSSVVFQSLAWMRRNGTEWRSAEKFYQAV